MMHVIKLLRFLRIHLRLAIALRRHILEHGVNFVEQQLRLVPLLAYEALVGDDL